VLIVDLVAQATDVQLRKMMIGWLLQGPAPSLTNLMNSRHLMLPQGNDGTLSRNDGGLLHFTAKLGGRLLLGVLCHEHRRPKRWCATVLEMKEVPSGSVIRSLIPSHRELLRSKAGV